MIYIVLNKYIRFPSYTTIFNNNENSGGFKNSKTFLKYPQSNNETPKNKIAQQKKILKKIGQYLKMIISISDDNI